MKVFSVSQRTEIRKDYEFEFPVDDFTYECGVMTIIERESESCRGVHFPERNTVNITADFGLSWNISVAEGPEDLIDAILAKMESLESVHYGSVEDLMESLADTIQSIIDNYKEE